MQEACYKGKLQSDRSSSVNDSAQKIHKAYCEESWFGSMLGNHAAIFACVGGLAFALVCVVGVSPLLPLPSQLFLTKGTKLVHQWKS